MASATPSLLAFGLGLARTSGTGAILDVYFPAPVFQPEPALGRVIGQAFGPGAAPADADAVRRFCDAASAAGAGDVAQACAELTDARDTLVAVRLDADTDIAHTAEAYLKLHLLSHRLTLPNTLNLNQLFAHLPNVAWTSDGAIAIGELGACQRRARMAGRHLEVYCVDKFPRMTNYVVPSGVRIADGSRIRLGAYLGDGTTVMHEGFVNFNAGALGPNMVEGRISQGVVVGAHSDLGGSSSTMGTLSGGGSIRITIGEHCLIGANAGTGIPLGDRCTIEAGLYITAGTPVMLLDDQGHPVQRVKARELAGQSDLLFVRNGTNGQVECRTNRRAIELNALLHAHN
ncbi:MAG: 2,3,4,5-tetrahydropyridine-2,6-dicarboxylate N-succinyltransferase [Pseudomonadales bacterium]|nr:2,3,4,5-tetrahydropyridine-2,6-dicarboxylate N-succinyltransferase [Pseudomonadales bacterium]